MMLSFWIANHSLWSTISSNHMTPLCDHPVIHSALTNKHAAWRKRSAGLWEMQILCIQTVNLFAQLSGMEELGKKQELMNGTSDISVQWRNVEI